MWSKKPMPVASWARPAPSRSRSSWICVSAVSRWMEPVRGLAGADRETAVAQSVCQTRPGGQDAGPAGAQIVLVLEGGSGGGQAEHIAVVGVLDLEQLADQVRPGDGVAEADAGQRVGLAQA